MLSSGVTSLSQTTGMPPASRLQSGVNVRMRDTRPASIRASTTNSVGASSRIRVPVEQLRRELRLSGDAEASVLLTKVAGRPVAVIARALPR